MSRTPRTKARKPPLSKPDAFLYALIIVLGMVLVFAVFILFMLVIPRAIAFSRFGVVAVTLRAATVICPVPMFVAVLLTTIVPASIGLEQKQPILGNKTFKPRFGTPVIRTFPLFSREFRDLIYPRIRQRVKRYCLASGIVLLISLALLPLGLLQSKTLSYDGTLRTYNILGQVSHISSVEDAEEMIILITGRHNGRHSPKVTIRYECPGHTYQFTTGAFEADSYAEALSYMLRLKEQRGGRYEVEDRRLKSLLEYGNHTAEERALLYELFDYRDRP